jgi:hypothetical protein
MGKLQELQQERAREQRQLQESEQEMPQEEQLVSIERREQPELLELSVLPECLGLRECYVPHCCFHSSPYGALQHSLRGGEERRQVQPVERVERELWQWVERTQERVPVEQEQVQRKQV